LKCKKEKRDEERKEVVAAVEKFKASTMETEVVPQARPSI